MKRGVIVGEIWASRRVADLAGRSLKLVVTPSGPDGMAPDAAAVSAQAERQHQSKDEPALFESDDVAALAWESLTVAIDTLDARSGQVALIAYGSGARNVLAPGPDNRHVLCDAAVALLVDSPSPSPTVASSGPPSSHPPHSSSKAG